MKLMKFTEFHAKYSPQLSQEAFSTYIDLTLMLLNSEKTYLTIHKKTCKDIICSYFSLKDICRIAGVSIIKATKIRDELIESSLLERYYPFKNKSSNYILNIIPVSIVFDVFMDYIPLDTLYNIVKNGLPINEFYFMISLAKEEKKKNPILKEALL